MYINMDESETFCTEFRPKENTQQSKLRNYVQNLSSKIEYAKWKQTLVLKYNYMPIRDMIEKLQAEKLLFQRRVQQQQDKCRNILQNKDILQQLHTFHAFSKTLDIKLNQLQHLIDEQKVKKKQLSKLVKDKSSALQKQIKTIMKLEVKKHQNRGINSTKQLIALARLHKQEDNKNTRKQFNSVPSLSLRSLKKDQIQIKHLIKSSQRDSLQPTQLPKTSRNSQLKSLLISCLNQVLQSDYGGTIIPRLDGYQKKKNKFDGFCQNYKAPVRRKTKSEITDRSREPKGSLGVPQNIVYEWEQFKRMSWTQILQLILSKPKGIQKFRNII